MPSGLKKYRKIICCYGFAVLFLTTRRVPASVQIIVQNLRVSFLHPMLLYSLLSGFFHRVRL